MHKIGIIQRDLKIDNILIADKNRKALDARIGDLGLARKLKPGELLRDRCGTPSYIAPELLRG